MIRQNAGLWALLIEAVASEGGAHPAGQWYKINLLVRAASTEEAYDAALLALHRNAWQDARLMRNGPVTISVDEANSDYMRTAMLDAIRCGVAFISYETAT